MIIPPINSKGSFTLKPPFSNILRDSETYKVTGIRTITELKDSELNPLENIYKPVGLTEKDMLSDIQNEVPIVVFQSEGFNYAYIPASYINSMPNIIGEKYQDLIIALNLGSLPVGIDLSILNTALHDLVYDTIGVDSTPEVITASAIKLISKVDHDTFSLLRANRASITKSCTTRTQELETLLTAKLAIIANLECYIKNNLGGPC